MEKMDGEKCGLLSHNPKQKKEERGGTSATKKMGAYSVRVFLFCP
jgi:hypothetical protein